MPDPKTKKLKPSSSDHRGTPAAGVQKQIQKPVASVSRTTPKDHKRGTRGGVAKKNKKKAAGIKDVAGVDAAQGKKSAAQQSEGTGTPRSVSGVPQEVIVCPMQEQVVVLLSIIRREQFARPTDHRILVFFPAAEAVDVMEALFRAMGIPAVALHHRLPKNVHTHRAALLKRLTKVLIFTTGKQRGGAKVEYPPCTCVVQCGLPRSAAVYLKRLGHVTDVKPKGKGVLLLAKFELTFATRVAHLGAAMVPPPPPDRVAQALIRKGQLKISGGRIEGRDYTQSLFIAITGAYSKNKAEVLTVPLEEVATIVGQFIQWLFSLQKPPPMPWKFQHIFQLVNAPGIVAPQRRGAPPNKVHQLLEEQRAAKLGEGDFL
eukprot:TRINITY_DN1291_c0_g1_i1.p1 TRINITY_DN1291_c0_g1~~TRINITY_DN1291_c0_g1_i1.p1  ORF type:complete len:392 (+),score=113.52 TRINITY_DN1291_c0_g1_i1:59-1177(+)